MKQAIMYTKGYCPFCDRAKDLLGQYNDIALTEIDVEHDLNQMREMIEKTQRRTVPQIFIDGQHIGGYDELAEFEKTGKLKKLLEQ